LLQCVVGLPKAVKTAAFQSKIRYLRNLFWHLLLALFNSVFDGGLRISGRISYRSRDVQIP
jgi:hypothetical protein